MTHIGPVSLLAPSASIVRAASPRSPPPLGLLRCLRPPLCPRTTASPPAALPTGPQWPCAAQGPSPATWASHAPDRTCFRPHLHPKARSSPRDVIALLLLVPGTRKASLRGCAGCAVFPLPSHGPHHLPLGRRRGPISVCLGRCNQSATNWVTETTHFSPSREPGGPSSRCRPARSTPHLLLRSPVSDLFSVPRPELSF